MTLARAGVDALRLLESAADVIAAVMRDEDERREEGRALRARLRALEGERGG